MCVYPDNELLKLRNLLLPNWLSVNIYLLIYTIVKLTDPCLLLNANRDWFYDCFYSINRDSLPLTVKKLIHLHDKTIMKI